MTIERKPKGSVVAELKTLDTTATGVYALKTTHRSGQHYRVRWTAPDGTDLHGSVRRGLLGS